MVRFIPNEQEIFSNIYKFCISSYESEIWMVFKVVVLNVLKINQIYVQGWAYFTTLVYLTA
jgi:hypothetical protein